jgi:hypothetical protein
MHDPNNANRAHLEKGGSLNRPTPQGGVASARATNDLPPPIRGDAPMTLDPHAAGRHSHENMERKPGEVSRSARTAETRRRLEDRTPKYKY